MSVLILDGFPGVRAPIHAYRADGQHCWVMDRDEPEGWSLPEDLQEVRVAHDHCTPSVTEDRIARLRALGFGGVITLATVDGTAPFAPPGVVAVAPQDITPFAIAHYGEHTAERCASGVVLTDDLPLFLTRPERISVSDSPDMHEITEAIDHFISLCTPGTATMHTDGAWSLPAGFTEVLLSRSMTWQTATLRGPVSISSLAALVRAVMGMQVRGGPTDPVVIRVQHGSACLAAVQSLLQGTPLTPARVQAIHDTLLPLCTPGTRDEAACRTLDDLARTLVFLHLPKQGPKEGSPVAQYARRVLGSPEAWVPHYHRAARSGTPRVCIVPTWQCELRCRYCTIKKQSGREMDVATAERSVDLLLSSMAPDVSLHFFGGEPFLAWPVLSHVMAYGREQSARTGQVIHTQFTTNAFSLTEAHLDALMPYSCHFQLSLDGTSATQNDIRRAWKGGDSYARSPAHRAHWFIERNLSHEVICVVHPSNVSQLVDNVQHIWDMGYTHVQLNYAIGAVWDAAATEHWLHALKQLGTQLQARWAAGASVTLSNVTETRKRVRSNLHITVDWDGHVYGSNAFLYLEQERARFHLGHLDDGHSYTRYLCSGLGDEAIKAAWRWKGSHSSNAQVGAILNQFCDAMRPHLPEGISQHRRL